MYYFCSFSVLKDKKFKKWWKEGRKPFSQVLHGFIVQKLLTQFTAAIPANVARTGPIHMHIFFAIILLILFMVKFRNNKSRQNSH